MPLKWAAWSKNCQRASIPTVSSAINDFIPTDAENVKNGNNIICICASGSIVPNTPKTVHMAPEAPREEPILPVAIFDTWLKNDVITQEDK